MACLDIVHTKAGNRLFYNIDAAVGKGCANRRPDVLLVQYLLKEGCKAPGLAKIEEGAGFTQAIMEITGTWDIYWGGYLSNYLLTLKLRGKPIVKDNRVDPVIAGTPFGAIHHMQHTILYLNLGYGDLRPNDFPRLYEQSDCPGELRSLLQPKFV
ncbi:MAG: hypothetical protein V7604_2558 [Hyphomicrobiales bacterium]|jgi:hypothetical protein